jgi:hypothetical protein
MTATETRMMLERTMVEAEKDPRKLATLHELSNAVGKTTKQACNYLDLCRQAKIKPTGQWAEYITG